MRAIALVVAVFLVGALQGCADESGDLGSSNGAKSITIGEVQGYSDAVAINALWKHLLEEKGWSVEIKQLQLGAMFGGMARGGIDAYLDVWLPTTHGTYVKEYEDDLTILEKPWNKEAEMGLAVPAYSDIESLSDLRDHVGELDGKIIGIEPASGEMKLLKKQIMPKYDLDKDFKLVPSSTPAMLSALDKAIAKKQPVVVALWKPHWAWSSYDIRFLDDPKKAWPPSERVHIAMAKEFAADNTQVSTWFGRTKLDAAQWGSLMEEIEANDGNPDKGVQSWLQEPGNRKLVESWTAD